MAEGTRTLQVGVKALIHNDQGRLLLLENRKPWEGQTLVLWDIPGGRIEFGESTLDGLRREIKEETGLDLTAVERVVGVQDILRLPKLHVVRITYLVRAEGELVLNHSDESDTTHATARWFTPDELTTINLDPYAAELLPTITASHS